MLDPRDVSEFLEQLEIPVAAEEKSDRTPVLLVNVAHLCSIYMVQHQVALADETEIPVTFAGRHLVSVHCPCGLASGSIAGQVAAVLVRAQRIVIVSAEYRIKPPGISLKILCRHKGSHLCLRISRIDLEEVIVAGNQSERQGHAGYIHYFLFHDHVFFRCVNVTFTELSVLRTRISS